MSLMMTDGQKQDKNEEDVLKFDITGEKMCH